MEEVKEWKEAQQQLSTNEVLGSYYKPLATDIARGWPRYVCDYKCLHKCGQVSFVCVNVKERR